MGRPPSDLDDYLDWQERLESFRASGLSIDEFCLQEGVSRSTYYRWVDQLKEGIPKGMVVEKAAREKAESGQAAFVPITLKASPVEIELPNGGVVRPASPLRTTDCRGESPMVGSWWTASFSPLTGWPNSSRHTKDSNSISRSLILRRNWSSCLLWTRCRTNQIIADEPWIQYGHGREPR